jgi:uncharacterized protein (TIGR00255 family)
MLLSMTGFGEARRQQEGLTVAVEVRAINSRYCKLSVRAGDGYSALEPRIEEVARNAVRRGTLQVNVRIDRLQAADDYRINADVLGRYRVQLQSLYRQWDLAGPVPVSELLALPGVVEDREAVSPSLDEQWPVVREAVEAALENLTHMRVEEGRAMAADLETNCRAIAAGLERVAERAPLVVEAFRNRLKDRLEKALAEFNVTLEPSDLVREVSLYADRGDISEEIVRLRSHLDQFGQIMGQAESAGRKLEFVTQEMFREANTIGSKANDVEIARHVIDIKTAIERIREMIQNVE